MLTFAIGAEPGPTAIGRLDDERELKSLFADLADGLACWSYLAAGIDAMPADSHARIARIHAIVEYARRQLIVPRVYLATCDAQAVLPTDRVEAYSQAAVHGYGRVAHNEFAALAVTLVDHDADPASIAALANELLADDVEDDVAFRAGSRLARRVRPLSPLEMRRQALVERVAEPQAVVLERSAGEAQWRASQVPASGQESDARVPLALHRLVQEGAEGADGRALCEFVARVLRDSGHCTAGQWLAGCARMRPASHADLRAEDLCVIEIDGPLEGAERLITLWAGVHDASRCVLPLAESRSLLLFGAPSVHGQAVKALAPLLGIERVIDAE